MAEYGEGIDQTFVSEWDLSSKQYRIVVIGSGNQKVVCASQTNDGPIIGVVCNKPTSGNAARVRMSGIGKVFASDTVALGAQVGATSTGLAVTCTSGYALGQAMDSATSGSVFQVLIRPQEITL